MGCKHVTYEAKDASPQDWCPMCLQEENERLKALCLSECARLETTLNHTDYIRCIRIVGDVACSLHRAGTLGMIEDVDDSGEPT